MKLLLVQNGEIFCPDGRGKMDLLIDGDTVILIRKKIDRAALESTGLQVETVDAQECLVVPGFVDPHVHLLGSSGESGFSSQTPHIFHQELLRAGVTTVVGTLGVDTATHTMMALLAAAKGLKDEDTAAYIYTGGYDLPPKTLMGGVRQDILYVHEVVGVGEIAIADERSMHPEARDLARVVTDSYVAGILSKSAGVTHFHVGGGDKRLSILRELLNDFEIKRECLYPTHIERTHKLMDEAIALAKKGVAVDMDTVEEKLFEKLKYYIDNGGPLEQLTISSDAGKSSPVTRWRQIRECLLNHDLPLEVMLPFITSNPSRILKLDKKGSIAEGKHADLVILTSRDLEIRHLISMGVCKIKEGQITKPPVYERGMNRQIELHGRDEDIDDGQ